jgi:hypothetical protein
MPYAPTDSTRQLKAHSCFSGCKENSACLIGFDVDTRPACLPGQRDEDLWCVNPGTTECENLIEAGQTCYDSEG